MNKNTLMLAGGTLLFIVLGAILLGVGSAALLPASYFIIAGLAVVGLTSIVGYLRRPVEQNRHSNGFVIGMTSLILSIIALFNLAAMKTIIPFLLALLITLNGVRQLQNAIDVGRLKIQRSWIVVVVALLNIIFGVVLMVNPFTSQIALFIALGVGLIICGLADFITSQVVNAEIRKFGLHQGTL